MEPTTAAMIAKAAIAMGANKKVWTGIASVIVGICIPFILAIVCILNLASAAADHNRAAVEKDDSIVMSQFTLKEVVRQTIFSISDNDNNKLMTGELFDINGEEFKIVSLDGHRISIRKIQLKNSYSPKKVVVPGKTLNEVSKILPGDADSDVTISFTEKHIVFEFDKTVVVSRLIEGEYFKIDQMLSSDYETKVKVNKKEFLSCIDRATLLVKEGDKKPIIVNITDNGMELKINSALGSMNEEIDIDKEGKDILIGFNPKFLIDALKVIDDETIHMYLMNPKAPPEGADPAGTPECKKADEPLWRQKRHALCGSPKGF